MTKYHITKKSYIGRVLISLFTAFVSLVAFVIFLLILDEDGMFVFDSILTFVLVSFIFIFTLVISLILNWIIMRKHVFYEEDKFFVVESGLINKKKIKFPFENINTIAIKRSILDRIIKTSILEIDTGTATAPLPEVKLLLEKEYALTLKQYLESKKVNKSLTLPDPNNYSQVEEVLDDFIYKASKKDLFLFGLLKPGYLVTIIFIGIVLATILQFGVKSEEFPNGFLKLLIPFTIVLSVLITITLFFGFASLVMFYDYKLKIKDDFIEYEYGLFSKRTFKFKTNKINALYLTQSIGLKLFKKYSLEVTIIGIGELNKQNQDNNSSYESKYIFPIANYEKAIEVLSLLNASDLLKEEFIKPKKFKELYFIILPLIIPSFIYLSGIILYFIFLPDYFVILINLTLLYILFIFALLKRLKNHGFTFNYDLVVRKGSFTIKKILIKKNKIQQITFKENPLQLILDVGNINFKYKKLLGSINLICYTRDDFKDIKKNL